MPDPLADLPVFAVSGLSGAGKTTLLEAVTPVLVQRGLRVAVVKHDAHGIDVDRPGKDSDRLFRAGADVFLHGPGESIERLHGPGEAGLVERLLALALSHDVVLVEGHKTTPLPKVWLLSEGERWPPGTVSNILTVLPRDTDRPRALLALLDARLPVVWLRPRLRACVLIGGASRRMGRPKHLLPAGRVTWLERTVDTLATTGATVAIAGNGVVPASLASLPRLADVPDARGPLAGILAAMRHDPRSTWLVTACDLPGLTAEACEWLLSTRRPGVWATLPRLGPDRPPEPLLAHYDFRADPLLERLAAEGDFRPASLDESDRTITPRPPDRIHPAFRNANTPADREPAGDPVRLLPSGLCAEGLAGGKFSIRSRSCGRSPPSR
jgi:molybdopterin-guanine dinucleotide biosynthesis protein MobB